MPTSRKRPASARYDLVVIGAGPAGSTLAALFKRYNPDARVAILEGEGFPRHHVGESLLPGAVPVLREMGAYDKVAAAGFLRKIGVVFVWGEDRKPWDATFDRNKFLETMKLPDGASWHVLRSRYDEVLLETARELGVEARLKTRAVAPIERGGRIVGVRAVGPDGKAFALESETLADCSGQNGFLSKFRPIRRYSDDLRNVAAYAYFKGARWKIAYNGHPDKSAVFICSVPEGWFWFIPLKGDMVSVGLVSKADEVARRKVTDYRRFFLDAIAGCREIRPLLAKATLVAGVDPREPKKDFFTMKDWSFASRRSCGPGWLAAGDAAFFVDPLLSSGVAMAHLSGRRAAYALTTMRREKDAGVRALLSADYDRFCRGISDGFFAMVRYWYYHEPSKRAWQKRATSLIAGRSPYRLDDKDAFILVLSGISGQFENAYFADGRHESGEVARGYAGSGRKGRSAHVPELFLFGRNDRQWKTKAARRNAWDGSRVPTWRVKPKLALRLSPLPGRGLLRPLTQAAFPAPDAPADDPATPSRLLPGPCVAALERVDGRRGAAAIQDLVRARFPLPGDLLDDMVRALFEDLRALGVLSLEKAPRRAAPTPAPSAAMRALRAAETALAAGGAAEAEALAARAIDGGLDYAWPRALRGEARRRDGRLREAVADLESARLLRSGPPARVRRRVDALLDESEELLAKNWLAGRIAASLEETERAAHAAAGRAFAPDET